MTDIVAPIGGPGGTSTVPVATVLDSVNDQHFPAPIEYVDGGGLPVLVSLTSPLPMLLRGSSGNTASVSASGNLGAILATGDNVAGRVKLTDGTNIATVDSSGRITVLNAGTSGSVAAVKPASTAALAADPALVVSISPNTQPTVLLSGATLDGAAFTPGVGTAFRSALYLVDEAAGSTVAEDAIGLARMDIKRAQVGVIEDATTRGQRAAVDSSGRLSVNVQASASLNLNVARADNAAFTPGSTTAIPASYLVDEVTGGTATEDAAGIARMDTKRAQIFVMEDGTTRGQRAVVDSNGNQNVSLRGGASFGSAPASFTATTSTSIFAGSNSAKERIFMNDSDQDLLLGLGNAVTSTNYTVRVRAAGGFYSTNFSGSILGMMVATIVSGQCLVSTLSA